MNVSSIMTTLPVTAAGDANLDEVARLMDHHGIRHVPVMAGDELLGVVSDRDILAQTGWLPARVRDVRRGVGAQRQIRAIDVCHAPTNVVGPGELLVTIPVDLLARGIGCLPVVDGDRLVGIVTETDFMTAYFLAAERGDLASGVDPHIEGCMTTPAESILVHATLFDAADKFMKLDIRHLPVMSHGELVGIVSDRDLRRAVGLGRRDDYPVEEVMSRDVVTLEPHVRLSEAVRLMVEEKISAVPVLRSDDLVGILTTSDALAPCMEHLRASVESGSA